MRRPPIGSVVSALVVLVVARTAFGQGGGAPQLGRAPLGAVVAALTTEEKVKLVVGMGFYPSGFPAGALPPGGPGDDTVPQRVPGAAGRSHAIARLGIPSLTFADGPAGVRIDPIRNGDSSRTYYATAFPVGTLLASTWDTALVRRVGVAFGGEVRAFGVDVLLAPGMNVHRNPLGGRNFEYYSEDPLVTGRMAAAFVAGVQSNGVGTSIKHFAGNEQEFNRMMMHSAIGERALREIYLKGFEIAVREAQPWTVMSSYNLINGTYASQSRDLLTALLRDEWGFRGLVMSDWYGGHDAAAQLRAGNDLLMPGTGAQMQALPAAVRDGSLSQRDLDASVTRVLALVLRSPTFRRVAYASRPPLAVDAALARRAAAEGMVLLRNEARTLPLAAGRRVAAFGIGSYSLIAGGTGSGDVNRAYTVTVDAGLRDAGLTIDSSLGDGYRAYLAAERAKLPTKRGLLDPAPVIAEREVDSAAVDRAARSDDVALLTIGRSAGEGADRAVANDFDLTATERSLIERVSAAFHAQGKRLVVVLNVGGVVEVASWRDRADAILLAWQPGEEGGHAIADLLTGHVAPSGRLATTFPMAYADVPHGADFPGRVRPGAAPAANPLAGQESENTYAEGVYVGYRYYSSFGVKPAYEFGYGLGYTTFSYAPLRLSASTFTGRVSATVTVTNAGATAGREVVQLYVSAPAATMDKPERELRAFAKTRLLAPGQSQTVTFALTPADLASFDTRRSAWVADSGSYTVRVGSSSAASERSVTFRVPAELLVRQSRPLLVPQAPIAEMKATAR